MRTYGYSAQTKVVPNSALPIDTGPCQESCKKYKPVRSRLALLNETASGTKVREFQSKAKDAIESVVSAANVVPKWYKGFVGPCSMMDYDNNDVDVFCEFELQGVEVKIWIYPDDLELKLDGESAIYEHQDYPGDASQQIAGFCGMLEKAVEQRRISYGGS